MHKPSHRITAREHRLLWDTPPENRPNPPQSLPDANGNTVPNAPASPLDQLPAPRPDVTIEQIRQWQMRMAQLKQGYESDKDRASLKSQERLDIMSGIQTQLANLQKEMPQPGTPEFTKTAQLHKEAVDLQNKVAARITRLQEYTRNSIYQIIEGNSILALPFQVAGTFLEKSMPAFKDAGTLIGPTLKQIWRPIEGAGSSVLNFLGDMLGHLSPNLRDAFKQRAQLKREKEQLMNAVDYQLKRMGIQIAQQDDEATEDDLLNLLQIQKDSGQNPRVFAAKVTAQLRIKAGQAIPLGELVTAAERAFPVDSLAASTNAQNTLPPPTPVDIDGLNGREETLSQFSGGDVRITKLTPQAKITVDGQVVAAAQTSAVGAFQCIRTSPDVLTVKIPANATNRQFAIEVEQGASKKKFTLNIVSR
ncbi:MAG: hypothetical protein G01um101425_712 [Candidatus Peregrinibacteria bacterium Gr01-1014_25]|nr:MAG: hypothetical protein G01um101425_712 [Candidatus Peregrinibacteria bacterium Gr01-1014_25]